METQQLISLCCDKIISINKMFDFEKYYTRINEIDHKISDPKIWNDPKSTGALMKERQ